MILKSAVVRKFRSIEDSGAARFQELRDYPRRLRSRERGEIPTTVPGTSTFELQDGDVEAVWRQFGPGGLTSREIQVERTYGNRHRLTVHQDKLARPRPLLVRPGLDPRLADGADSGGLRARVGGELWRPRLTEVAEVM